MIRTRFAPSPTGSMHIGSLRTAAYAYALAKHSGGQFLLRIEDTDQKREVKGSTEKIYSVLQKFQLIWDEEPVIQSHRLEIYQTAAKRLIQSGHAVSENGAVRLKIPPGETISFHDFILDHDVSWKSQDVPPAILLKSDGFPTYHLAMPVDDHDMGITHIIRSVEWLPSTPIHVLVFKNLGFDLPAIGHPSAILDPGGGKLSKRKGNVSVEQFLDDGYLPEALLNFVVLQGWAPKDNRELFTLAEFVKYFDPSGFQKSNPVMNLDKLNWFNGHYIRQKTDTELTQLVKAFVKSDISDTQITQIVSLIKDRLVKLSDFEKLASPFISPSVDIDSQLFTSSAKRSLASIASVLETTTSSKPDELNAEFKKEIERLNIKTGDYFMDMRVAIMGSKFTPPITESTLIIGIPESLQRVKNALGQLG